MTRYWEPGTQYNDGDIVEYEGQRYKIIQPHRSQPDWTPPITPALWGPLGGHDGNRHHHHEGDYNQPPEYQQPIQSQGVPASGYNPPPSGQGVEISHEERKTHWYDLDDKRKKELEIGGGLLAGVAALGAGYFAYKEHEKSEEQKKAQTWALSNWLDAAEARSEEYRRHGLREPAQWILNRGKDIPQQAIVVGQEKDWTLYICRAFHEGGIQVGKASQAFKKGAVIGYSYEEIHLDTYEILVGDMRGLRWVDASGHLNVDALGYRPVEGGREADGTLLYIAEAPYHGAVHPGKASVKLNGAMIPYDGTEKNVKEYRVLCYA